MDWISLNKIYSWPLGVALSVGTDGWSQCFDFTLGQMDRELTLDCLVKVKAIHPFHVDVKVFCVLNSTQSLSGVVNVSLCG